MELVFQERRLSHLKRTLYQSFVLEQTADVIVPDSYPDADRVVDAFGTVTVQDLQCGGEAVSVFGTVQAGAIFVSSEGEAHSQQARIPFTLRKELPPQTEDGKLQCCCRLCSVDARILNSRKLLLRVGILCELSVYGKEEQTYGALAEPSEHLQLLRRELPLKLPMAAGEKRFALNDELELPTGIPAIAELLKTVERLQILEQKVVGGKVVFKGEALVHILYCDADRALHSYEWKLPFSQFVELDQDFDDGESQVQLLLAELDIEPDSQMESRRLFLRMALIAQCTVFATQTVELIEDAFCTDAELTPQWRQWESCALLDRQSFHETAALTDNTPAASLVDAWAYAEEAEVQRNGDRLKLRLPVNCNLLYYDTEGKLQGTSLRPVAEVETELHEKGSCVCSGAECSEIYCSVSPRGMELRLPIQARLDSYAEQELRAICAGEITELPSQTTRRPAVLLRRTDGQEELWDIAKACRTPVEAVVQANELDGTMVPANTMLLIPM